MAPEPFRIFDGPEESPDRPKHVSVRLGDIGPMLADAYRCDRTWLRDFQNQRVRISSDLFEVICAYRKTSPSA